MSPILYMQSFSAPCRAVLLTAEAIGLKLQQKIVDLSKREHLTPEFLKLNPQHTIPTLVDNETVLWDSHAINAYLVKKYASNDSLYPHSDVAKVALVDQRLHFDSGSIFNWMRIVSRGVKYRGLKSLTDEQREGIADGYEHLNNFLKGSEWVAGNNVTIADFSLIASVTSVNLFCPIDPQKYPNVIEWLKRAKQLPCYKVNEEGLVKLREMLKILID